MSERACICVLVHRKKRFQYMCVLHPTLDYFPYDFFNFVLALLTKLDVIHKI